MEENINPRSKKTFLIFLGVLFVGVIGFIVSTYQLNTRRTYTPRAADNRPNIPALTHTLLSAINTTGAVSSESMSEGKFLAVAQERKKAMEELIEKNPQAFLTYATLYPQRNRLSKSIQSAIEDKQSITGELTIIHEDRFVEQESKFHYFVKTSGDTYEVYFAENNPQALTGSKVVVTGITINKKMAVWSATGESKKDPHKTRFSVTQAHAEPSTKGNQKVLVILGDLVSEPRPLAPSPELSDNIKRTLFTLPSSVNEYYKENSYNQTHFEGEVVGWYQIVVNTNYCLYTEWEDKLLAQAKEKNVNVDGYSRYLFVLSNPAGCRWAGLGTVGGNPSKTWVVGPNVTKSFVYAHELGHNLGAMHANSLNCTEQSCTSKEYGDPYDVMGSSGATTHFNAPHKEEMVWLSSSNIRDIFLDGTYTLNPIESNGGSNVLRIYRPSHDEYFFIEFRKRTGFDQALHDSLFQGVSIRTWNEGMRSYTNSIPPTPLKDGEEYIDPVNNIRIKQLSHTQDGAKLFINPPPNPGKSFQIKSWQSVELPSNKVEHSVLVSDGKRMYALDPQQTSMFYTNVTATGDTQTWKESPLNLDTLKPESGLIYNNAMYVAGGDYGFGSNARILYTKITEDSSLQKWQSSSSPFPTEAKGLSVALYNGYLIFKGNVYNYDTENYHLELYKSKIQSDGSLGSWASLGTVPIEPQYFSEHMVVMDNQLLILGHAPKDIIRIKTAKLTNSASVANWKTNTMNHALDNYGFALSQNVAFIVGGEKERGLKKDVYVANISPSGVFDFWKLDTSSLPYPLTNVSALTVNKTVYVYGQLANNAPTFVLYKVLMNDNTAVLPTRRPIFETHPNQ